MNENIWQKVCSIDLSGVIIKMFSRKSWFWKLRNNAAKIEEDYRRFLYLVVTNQDKAISPWNQNLDDLWHEHILDTKKYMEDCNVLFGHYLHHDPHTGENVESHMDMKISTHKLYTSVFGSMIGKSSMYSLSAGCGTECGGLGGGIKAGGCCGVIQKFESYTPPV